MTVAVDTIIVGLVGTVMSTLATAAYSRISSYIKDRERREIKKEAQLELHYIKLDAVVYTLGTVGEHKSEFERVYTERYRQMLAERKDLEEIIKQNS